MISSFGLLALVFEKSPNSRQAGKFGWNAIGCSAFREGTVANAMRVRTVADAIRLSYSGNVPKDHEARLEQNRAAQT